MSTAACHTFEDYARRERAECSHAYRSDARYSELVEKAKVRGFRPATPAEIEESATSARGAIDIYSWRGGLWVPLKKEPS